MTVGLTQSEGRLAELEPMLRAAGFEVLRQPLVETKTIPGVDLEPLQACPWWLFTSVSAVWALRDLGVSLSGHKIGAVGEVTAGAIQESSGTVYLTSPEASVMGLLEAFLALSESGPIGLPQGNRALSTLSDGLREAGYEVRSAVIYETEPVAWPKSLPIPEITLVASPSALERLTNSFARKTRFVALGSTTAQAVQARGWTCVVPKGVRPEEILESIQNLAKTAVAVGGNHAD